MHNNKVIIIMELKLKEMQEKCNKLYDEYGLTDEVLDMQIMINKLRHEHDIADENNIIYGDYVQ